VALVIGISPDADLVTIENALKAQNVDASNVKVFGKGSPSTDSDDGGESTIDFINVYQAMETNSRADDMTKNTGIIEGSGGTGVPGLNTPSPSLGSLLHDEAVRNYLGGNHIPADEVENFNEAIEDGRPVVMYAADDATGVEAAFKAAGFKNVRSF
jgi:hypothetical protein